MNPTSGKWVPCEAVIQGLPPGPGRPQQASLVLGFTYSQFAPSHSPHSDFIICDIISLIYFTFSVAFSTLSASSVVNPVVSSSFHLDD